ncbi:MAG: phosphodiesterase [Actinomycetales bacterium]|nr:phosphodiesterase [Actinomycetales bacterium]
MSSELSNLRHDVEQTGYYPQFVLDSLSDALAQEEVRGYFVHLEATFDSDELRRHVTVLVITATRLVVGHTDEYPPDETSALPYATSTVESVPLSRVHSVVVNRRVSNPARYVTGGPMAEVLVTIGWGAVNRLEVEPADCEDPQCEADHGYFGSSSNDDLSIRVSAEADGKNVVARALAFARLLNEATLRGSQVL